MTQPKPSSAWLGHQKSPAVSLAYTALCSISTASTAACLLYYSLSGDYQHMSSMVRVSCMVTGVVMLGFVAVGAAFFLLSWRVYKTIANNATRYKSQEANPPQSSSSTTISCCLFLVGMLCLTMLILSVLLELSLICLLWWTSHKLGLQYQVRENCFYAVRDSSGITVNNLHGMMNCPQIDGLSRLALYWEVPVQMPNGLVMNTRECQGLDGRGLQEDCLSFLSFWSWFKVWRILLPLVILMKLPLLILSCYSGLSAIGSHFGRKKLQEQQQSWPQGGQYDMATSSVSLDSHLLPSSPQPVDPVKFYGNICATVQDRNALEKQEVREHIQGQEMLSLASKPVTLRSTATMARYISNTHAPAPCSPPPLTAVACPVPPVGKVHLRTNNERVSEELTQDDSPPDIQDHIISTPIESDKLTMTPQFDLSKVIKPAFDVTNAEDNTVPSMNAAQANASRKLPESEARINQFPRQFDFDLQKIEKHSKLDEYCAGSMNTHRVSSHRRCPASLNLLPPPPKPIRTCSVSSSTPIAPERRSSRTGDIEIQLSSISKISSPAVSYTRSPVPPCLQPPPKPRRTSSVTFTPAPTELISFPIKHGQHIPLKPPPPPPPPPYQVQSPLIFHPSTQVQVVVEDASLDSDYDSSTCGSARSTTPIVRQSKSSQKRSAWPTSPEPPRVQRSSTSAAVASSPGMVLTDIQEISRKAMNISQSSNVDWSKLP